MTQVKYITDAQKLLLQVATQPRETAIAAWEAWKTIVDLDESDAASYQLLPLVYRNLSNYGYQDDLMPKLKGIYRLRWCKNQVILQLFVKILHILQQSGIEAIILKDVALLSQYYPDLGQRNIYILAILVHPQQALKTREFLNELGWQESEKLTPKVLQTKNVINFYGQPDCQLELHWYLTGISIKKTFEQVKFLQLQDISTLFLNSEAQLIQLLLQKTSGDQVSHILWINDILMVLNQENNFDFERIILLLSKYALIGNLPEKIPMLAEVADLIKPQIFVESIKKINSYNKIDLCEPDLIKPHRTAWQIFRVRYKEYLRIAANRGENFNIFGFIKYLQVIWELQYLWQVPIKVVKWNIKNRVI
ncbi:MAG TPA: nucleotidyltransferase family protein [Oculatellaceae cyanobacterium]|jgi:hypothetical protein